MLLSGAARLTRHAGQSRLLLTLAHEAGDQIRAMIANIRKGLDLMYPHEFTLSPMNRSNLLKGLAPAPTLRRIIQKRHSGELFWREK
jgi:hypothetical protein